MSHKLCPVTAAVLAAIGSLTLATAQESAPPSNTKAAPKEFIADLGGGVKMEMILIPAGQFMMGSPDSDRSASNDEKPRHLVRITHEFYMGKYPVTQEQWTAVMGNNPSLFINPKNPVEWVSWQDGLKFLRKMNEKAGGGKWEYPTEAQWEYACRAGSTTIFCFGDDEAGLNDYGWYDKNSGGKSHPVGEKKPNAWGLYDMHGNVWQWVWDWYDPSYYAHSPTDDPTGPATGTERVSHGGTWASAARSARSANHGRIEADHHGSHLGFRAAMIPPNQ
jgi:formylglycine-generating enzyme required for sulfatase activity